MKWLHLSDLHICENADWNIYRKELLDHCKKNGPIDLVIVTGDFHDFSDKDDFSLAANFLKQLIEGLHLDIAKDLFLIPGNHDGSWPIDSHKKGNIAALKKEPVNVRGKEWEELMAQFDAYEKFVTDLIPNYPFEHPAREHCRIWNDVVNFIHCNSAVASDGKDKDEQLMNIDALSDLSIPDGLPSVILIHNYFEDIHKEHQDRIIGVIRCSNVKAYFCGDRHIQEAKYIATANRQNSQVPCIVSYKSAPDTKDTYSAYGVIIGSWNDEKAVLKGWTWQAKEGFIIDSKITDQTIEMGTAYQSIPEKEEIVPVACDVELYKESKINTKDMESLEKEFRKLYFNMSEAQIEQFNRKFSSHMRILDKNETLTSIHEFVYQMVEQVCSFEVLQFMNQFFKGGTN